MNHRRILSAFLLSGTLVFSAFAAPVIDPIPSASIPAGKTLILPVTAGSPNGRPLTFTITSSTDAIALVPHTNNPFWKLSVVQVAAANAPGAFSTPFRGGTVTVTNLGDMTFMLFPEYAPHTVSVFQGLSASGFYNSNTIFHRVIAGFMNQGGDPQTNGLGGLVFSYDDEFNPQAIFSGNGQLALANSGPIQFELIQILEGRSLYGDTLGEGEGLHHLGFFVRDMDARLQAARAAGATARSIARSIRMIATVKQASSAALAADAARASCGFIMTLPEVCPRVTARVSGPKRNKRVGTHPACAKVSGCG